jgi:hypothetical protein
MPATEPDSVSMIWADVDAAMKPRAAEKESNGIKGEFMMRRFENVEEAKGEK